MPSTLTECKTEGRSAVISMECARAFRPAGHPYDATVTFNSPCHITCAPTSISLVISLPEATRASFTSASPSSTAHALLAFSASRIYHLNNGTWTRQMKPNTAGAVFLSDDSLQPCFSGYIYI